MPRTKTSLQQSLAEGNTRQTIEQLLTIAADRDWRTEALALSARYQHYLREKNGGRAEPHWLDTELNRINAAALDLIDQLPDGKLRGATNWKQYAAIAAAIASFLITYTLVSNLFTPDLPQKSSPEKAVEQQQPTPTPPVNVSTSGDNSPAVNAPNGSVIINYGETAPAKTPAKKDTLIKK